jgi:hypothetical protein
MHAEKFGTMINRMQWRPPALVPVQYPTRYGIVAPAGGAQTAMPQTVVGVLRRAGLNGLGGAAVEVNAVHLGEWDWGGIVKGIVDIGSNVTKSNTPPAASGYYPPSAGGSGGTDPALIAALVAANKPAPTDYTPWLIGGAAVVGVVGLALLMKR